MHVIRLLVLAALSATLGLTPSPAAAEWFADLYGGIGFTENSDHDNGQRANGLDITVSDIRYDDSAIVGARAGHWFESLTFLGVGLDVAHFFGPDLSPHTRRFTSCGPTGCQTGAQPIRKADINITSFGFDLWLRLPLLKSPAFPKGRLQPYIAVGPALFLTHFDVGANFTPAGQSDTDLAVGAKVGGGLAWQLHKNVALFTEYRFTHFRGNFAFQNSTAPAGRTTVSSDFTTHSILGGVSFRFP
jgi:opacity protein-like surface antigen